MCSQARRRRAHSRRRPITGFAPTHGLVERVTIYGHNLAGAQVWFNGVTAENIVVDPTGTHLRVNSTARSRPARARSW